MTPLVLNDPFNTAAWLDVAELVLANKFNNSDSSTRASLEIGLRGIPETQARRALRHLRAIDKALEPKPRKK